MTLTIGSLCSGYGGLDMAVRDVLDAEVVWHADPDPGASTILAHHWPDVPNLGDIQAVDWATVAGVDLVTGGFPCQDLSYAGRGAGIKEGTRSGLWYAVAAAVHALRPRLVVLENVRAIVARRPGLDVVLASLADLGFDAEWLCIRASDIGAPHERWRWFLLAWPANAESERRPGQGLPGPVAERRADAADTTHLGCERGRDPRDGRPRPSDGGIAAADSHGGRLPRHPERHGGPDHGQPEREPRLDADGRDALRATDWGRFTPAIHRWETALGRCAPRATDDRGRLTAAFVEWLMGLPAGHVTNVPGLTRTQQLHALGNGVVPAQAAAAIRLLLDRACLEVAS